MTELRKLLKASLWGVLFSILFCPVVYAGPFGFGGDDVGNGGGLAEKNMLVAYHHLEFYSRICLDIDSCRLTRKERRVLADILAILPKANRSGDTPLVFGSEKANPGQFIIDGELKIARTGSKPGTKIYINTDLLYSFNQMGQLEPMSVAQAVAVLIHEFGHHVSQMSHQDLDLLGVKVSLMLQNRIQLTPVLPFNPWISAMVVQGPKAESFPQILLTVGDEIWDLSDAFKASVFCPVLNIAIPILPFPDLQLGRKEPLGVNYHNVHWTKSSTDESGGDFRIEGNLSHVCPSGTSKLALVNSFKVRIDFNVENEKGQLRLKNPSVRVTQTYEPWYKLLFFNF